MPALKASLVALRLACCWCGRSGGQGAQQGGGINTILYDGNRFYLTTPTDAEVESGQISPGYPIDTSSSGSVNVSPGGLTSARCLYIWNGLLQNPPKATNDFNEVVSSKNDMKYYVSVDGSGNDSVCRYYLVNALNKTANGGYEDPNNQTDKFKSFSYRPPPARWKPISIIESVIEPKP